MELVPRDEVLALGGDDAERERLHRSIERGLEDVNAGRTVEASEAMAERRGGEGRALRRGPCSDEGD